MKFNIKNVTLIFIIQLNELLIKCIFCQVIHFQLWNKINTSNT